MKVFNNHIKALLLVMPFLLVVGCKNKTDSENAVISFEKTRCYGVCPVYKAKLFNNGRIEFYPKMNHPIQEASVANIPKHKIQLILDKAEKIDFWSLNDVYDDERITDLPSTIITISTKSKSKKIKVRYNPPKDLKEIIQITESTIESAKYKPISSH